MNGVQFREKMRGPSREIVRGQISKEMRALQSGEQSGHFRRDVRGIAEHAAALGDPDSAVLARPRINVLKQVAMNGAIVADAQAPGGSGVPRPLPHRVDFEGIEIGANAKAGAVLQNRCSRITIGIGRAFVHALYHIFEIATHRHDPRHCEQREAIQTKAAAARV